MASLGSFSVDVEANLAKFESDLGRAKRLAEKRAEEMRKFFANAGQVIGGGLATATVGITALTKSAIDLADQLNLVSQRVGVSVESLSTLGFVAKQSDVEMSALQNGLVNLP